MPCAQAVHAVELARAEKEPAVHWRQAVVLLLVPGAQGVQYVAASLGAVPPVHSLQAVTLAVSPWYVPTGHCLHLVWSQNIPGRQLHCCCVLLGTPPMDAQISLKDLHVTPSPTEPRLQAHMEVSAELPYI